MSGYDDPNRPEWTGKRKAKNFARINAACKGLKTSGGKPPTECPKCGTELLKKRLANRRVQVLDLPGLRASAGFLER